MRLRVIRNIIVFSFAILVGCLWYIQCVQQPRYADLSFRNRIRLIPLAGPRGTVYDRHNRVLIGSRLAFDCAVIPQEIKADKEQIGRLSGLLGVPVDILKKTITEGRTAPFAPAVIKRDIGKETAIEISERSADFPGLVIQTYPKRYYPNANVCSHIAGYLGKISEEELNALRDYGYKTRDFVGRAGLELYYDDYLRGEDGGRQTEVDSRGRELRVLGIKEPHKGRDITLTIDLQLSQFIDTLVGGRRGAVVVMDSATGGILALTSKPDFDPNIFVTAGTEEQVTDILARDDYPLINRAISASYPPGSVFKIVTASAGLELKKIGEHEQLGCRGSYTVGNRTFKCWKKSGHGLQTITEAIKNSCNVFFYQLGRRVGVDGLADFASRYGFGRPSGIDLPYETDGVVPSRSWKKKKKGEPWYEGETVNYSIGQGYLLVTPLQLLRMVNTIGREGELVNPFLVKKIDDIDLSAQDKKRIDISLKTSRLIKEGMRMAVQDKRGTAKRAGVPGIPIAGKTGTAQTGAGSTHAWFAGFAPVKEPKVALVVFLEYGGKGGDKPSKIAARIFAKLKETGYL